MEITALIMAGGRGERFWPKSRKRLPKQFLSLTGDGKTMIQLTVERISPMVPMKNIYIATNQDYKKLVLEQLPEIPEENILCEPAARNTAPCIGLGAVHIEKRFGDALMLVLPSDHLIKQNERFLDILKHACETAEKDTNLVTIGITPSYPETGYGYIKFMKENADGAAYPVEQFVEKPDLETAKTYLEAGSYLWNSGMFVWKVSSILKNIREFMPDTYSGLMNIRAAIGTGEEQAVLEQEFSGFESQSIDYGIMEKAEHIYIIPGSFGWDDVGSWLAVERIQKADENGNVIQGNIAAVDTKNCVLQGGSKLIAAVGLEDIVIVDTEDATLVCAKNDTNNIKKIIEHLKNCKKEKYI